MCNLVYYTYSTCGHPDRDGRSSSGNSNLAYLHYCLDALREGFETNERTKICGERTVADLEFEFATMTGQCRTCFEASGAKKRESVKKLA
jgi:hypothetical protein